MNRRTFLKGALGAATALVTGVSVPVIAKEVSSKPKNSLLTGEIGRVQGFDTFTPEEFGHTKDAISYFNDGLQAHKAENFKPIWSDKLLDNFARTTTDWETLTDPATFKPILRNRKTGEIREFDIIEPDGTKHIITCDYGNNDRTVKSYWKDGRLKAL